MSNEVTWITDEINLKIQVSKNSVAALKRFIEVLGLELDDDIAPKEITPE